MAAGLGGPVARGSGVNNDVRKETPYAAYDKLSFDVVLREDGDVRSRALVRLGEIFQSISLIEQCLDQMPEGDFQVDMPTIAFPVDKKLLKTSMETHIHHFELSAYGFKVPKGEIYTAIEAPKGELGYYIISDGSEKPFRMRVRAPSFVNLQALEGKVRNMDYLADVIAMLGSLDPVIAEVDK